MDDLHAVVIGFVVDGNTRGDIVEWLAKKRTDCKDPGKAFDAACDAIRKSYLELHGHYHPWVVVGLKELYRRCVEIGDHKTAAGILKDIYKLTPR